MKEIKVLALCAVVVGFAMSCQKEEITNETREVVGEELSTKGCLRAAGGRPKKYDGKVGYQNLKGGHITWIEESPGHKVYQAIVFSKALKRKTDLVMVCTNKKGGWKHKLYFSTDLQMNYPEAEPSRYQNNLS